jgi:DNA-binding GntR family transcriptional regulator
MHCALPLIRTPVGRKLTIKHLQPIERLNRNATLADQVYESLRHAIVHGHLSPGSRLNQMHTARNLDVSQRTVREALARLVAEGLVSREPYKEFRVVGLSVEEIEEILHMRVLLEGWAMAAAACRISPDELDRMRELLAQMEASTGPESVMTLQGINRDFHWIAINACKKRSLIQMLKRLWDLMLPYSLAEEVSENYVEQTRKTQISHRQLVDALEARDGREARRTLVRHSEEAMEQVRTQVKRLNKFRARDNGSLFLQRLLPIRTSLRKSGLEGLQGEDRC